MSSAWWCPECGDAVAETPSDPHMKGDLYTSWDEDTTCPGIPIDLLAEREELLGWIRGADHYSNCPGGYWPHPCKCGLTELLARHAAEVTS